MGSKKNTTAAKVPISEQEFKFVWPKGVRVTSTTQDVIHRPRMPVPARLVFASDFHWPIVDHRAIAVFVEFLRDFKPDVLILGGDLYDCGAISSYPRAAAVVLDPASGLQAEFDSARPFLNECVKLVPKVMSFPGNHEERLDRMVNANLGLFGLRKFDLPTLAEMPSSIIQYPYGSIIEIGGVNYLHGDRLSNSKYGPANPPDFILKQRPGASFVMGHSHKTSSKTISVLDPNGGFIEFGAWSQGHLSDTSKQGYAGPSPGWSTGFTAVEYFMVNGQPFSTIHQLTLHKSRLIFGGKLYDGFKL